MSLVGRNMRALTQQIGPYICLTSISDETHNILLSVANKIRKNKKLKKDNEILKEGNDILGIYVGGGVKEQIKKIVKSMIKDIELATPLIRKNPRGVLFKTSIQSLARYAKRLNDIYQEMVKKIN